MNKPVLNAIITLLEFKKKITYTEIASVSKKSRLEVLQVLNKNKHFIRKDSKDNIIGLTNSSLINKYKYLCYWFGQENYGTVDTIEFLNKDLFNKLKENYVCGGFGDSYNVELVRKTETNIKKVEDAGLIEYFRFLKTDHRVNLKEQWEENSFP